MRKVVFIVITLIFISCKSVDDWTEDQVLSDMTIELAKEYVSTQKEYIELSKERVDLSVTTDLNDEELDGYLEAEKKIALTSQKVANSWFDFYLQLRQDTAYKRAYKGHYYFRKGIDTLTLSSKKKVELGDISIKDSYLVEEIQSLEAQARLAIGEIVSDNSTSIETDKVYSRLKRLYKDLD